MKRKVIKQGNNTLTITLPKEWTEQFGIKAGDEIEINNKEGTLAIDFPGKQILKKEFRAVIKKEEIDDSRYFKAYMDSMYISGHDNIVLELPDKKYMTMLQDFLQNNFIGYEITSFENNKCVIENITDPSKEKFEVILRRLFLMTKGLLSDFYSDLKSSNLDNFNLYKEQLKAVNLYTNYCLRIVSNEHKVSSYALWSLILRLTQIYNIMFYCYEKLPSYDSRLKFSKETMILFEGLKELFDMVYGLFYSFNISDAKKIHDKYYNLVYSGFYKCLMSKRKGELFVVFHLGKALRQILYIVQFILFYQADRNIAGRHP